MHLSITAMSCRSHGKGSTPWYAIEAEPVPTLEAMVNPTDEDPIAADQSDEQHQVE
jgi:hypothetical protein